MINFYWPYLDIDYRPVILVEDGLQMRQGQDKATSEAALLGHVRLEDHVTIDHLRQLKLQQQTFIQIAAQI